MMVMRTQRIGDIGAVGFVIAIASLLLTAPAAWADNPVNWSFFVETTGQDASWTSPTNLDLGFPSHDYNYEITTLELRVDRGILGEDWESFLSFLDLEDRVGGGSFGPLPATLANEVLSEGDLSANVTIGVDDTGQGFAQITNVQLGEVFGGLFDITGIRIGGNVTITALPEPASAAMLLGGVGLIVIRRRPSRRSARA